MFPFLPALVAVLIQQKAPYEMTAKSNCRKCSDNLLENIQLEYINILDFHHQSTVSDLKPLLSFWLERVCLGEGRGTYPSGLRRDWHQHEGLTARDRLEGGGQMQSGCRAVGFVPLWVGHSEGRRVVGLCGMWSIPGDLRF